MIAVAPARLGLDACDRMLALHAVETAQRFGRGALEEIDLPPVSGGRIDAGLLRVASVLFWTWEVEQAGLPQFVEALADGLMKGTLILPLERGGDRLGLYWRGRHERFTAEERRELYAQIFGDPARPDSSEVQPLFAAFVAALAEIGKASTAQPIGDLVVRANLAGRDLAAELTLRCAGMAAYAARDIVAHVRLALQILGDAEISRALGGGGPWMILETHGQEVLGRQLVPRPHLSRAASAHALVAWLADNAPSLEGGNVPIGRVDEVVQAAEAWQAEAQP
ncbi:MAG TPA: hypothetical protein VI356_19920 [Myxococcales bacterium]